MIILGLKIFFPLCFYMGILWGPPTRRVRPEQVLLSFCTGRAPLTGSRGNTGRPGYLVTWEPRQERRTC